MRSVGDRGMLVLVSDHVLHIEIDLSCADDELRGHVCDGVRAPRAFYGWLGLLGVLDAMIGSLSQEGALAGAGPVRSVK